MSGRLIAAMAITAAMLALAGVGISGYLALENLQGETGVCVGVGGCAEVQESRYGELFGVPVSVPGLLLYLALLAGAVGWWRDWGGQSQALALLGFLGFPPLEISTPLLTFLFLVALGVDYSIFLTTRAREEAVGGAGARESITTALAVTGGVITSAGVLLAAVFAVLGVLPLVQLAQIGVIVGFGVLLDTLVVRSLLVPAIVTLLGERFWWPSRPARGRPAGR